jgi:putative spermidine/putrescine transport system ATP-binding protein
MARVADMLDLVGLSGFAHRLPRQLSGGQQQRVALARALAFEPNVLLLDEPLSSLDANLRHQLQSHLRQLQRTTGVTTVIVTHDREEAMGVSSRIVVLDRGRVQQVASAPDLYRAPASAFVMRFTGECNLVDGVVGADGRVEVPGIGPVGAASGGSTSGDRVQVGFRPEHVRFAADGLDAVVVDAAFLGPIVTYELRPAADGAPVIVARHDTSAGGEIHRPGDHVSISIPPHAFHAFPLEESHDHTPSPRTRPGELARPAARRLWRGRR